MSLLPEVARDKPPMLSGKFQQRSKRQICLRDLSNQREVKMPDGPVMKMSLSHSTPSPPPPPPPPSLPIDVPPPSVSSQHSTSGSTSPRHKVALSVDVSSQDDTTSVSNLSPHTQPPVALAGSARQLSKLKRFLMTLQQFASDISPEIGDRVRTLVLALVNSHITIEDFHSRLQEATNFPLRPFVVPFLKANLPFLQRELLQSSPRHSILGYPSPLFSSSIHSYLSQSSPREVTSPEINANGKRPSPDRTKENGYDCPPAKRPHQLSSESLAPRPSSYFSSRSHHITAGHPFTGDLRLAQDLLEREHSDTKAETIDRAERDRVKHFDGYGSKSTQNNYTTHQIHSDQEDWQFVESMLINIIVMVDRCKRILESLEERNRRYRDETAAALLLRTHPKLNDPDYRRCPINGNSPGFGGHGSDDQLSLVHRRTEEAIHEVRMQAVLELQQAVAAAEVKASHIVAGERAKMELAILEARKQAQEEILAVLGHQEKSNENCWNCGRKANETCSGCRRARYCGSYCQHKDWETHHRVCGAKVQQAQSNVGSRSETNLAVEPAATSPEARPFSAGNVSSTEHVDPLVEGNDPCAITIGIGIKDE